MQQAQAQQLENRPEPEDRFMEWVVSMQQRYSADDLERMTRWVGCNPAFSFLGMEVLEVILQRLDEHSRIGR